MNREDYIADAQVVKRANEAVRLALEKKKVIEAPVVVYDRKSKNICRVHADGTREIIGQRETVGRYSERYKKHETT